MTDTATGPFPFAPSVRSTVNTIGAPPSCWRAASPNVVTLTDAGAAELLAAHAGAPVGGFRPSGWRSRPVGSCGKPKVPNAVGLATLTTPAVDNAVAPTGTVQDPAAGYVIVGIGHFDAASVADTGRGSGCVEPFGAGVGPGVPVSDGAADAKPGKPVRPVNDNEPATRPTTSARARTIKLRRRFTAKPPSGPPPELGCGHAER